MESLVIQLLFVVITRVLILLLVLENVMSSADPVVAIAELFRNDALVEFRSSMPNPLMVVPVLFMSNEFDTKLMLIPEDSLLLPKFWVRMVLSLSSEIVIPEFSCAIAVLFVRVLFCDVC